MNRRRRFKAKRSRRARKLRRWAVDAFVAYLRGRIHTGEFLTAMSERATR